MITICTLDLLLLIPMANQGLVRDSRTLKNGMSSWWRSHPGVVQYIQTVPTVAKASCAGRWGWRLAMMGWFRFKRVEVGQLKVYQYCSIRIPPKKNRTKKVASGLEDQLPIPARGPAKKPCLNWRVQWFWGGRVRIRQNYQNPGPWNQQLPRPRKICKRYSIPKGHFGLFSNHQFAGALAVSFKEWTLFYSFFLLVVPRFIVARLEDCRICRVVYPSVGGQGASLYRWCGFLASGNHRMNHDPFPWLDHNPFNMIINHDVAHVRW